MITDQSISIHQ